MYKKAVVGVQSEGGVQLFRLRRLFRFFRGLVCLFLALRSLERLCCSFCFGLGCYGVVQIDIWDLRFIRDRLVEPRAPGKKQKSCHTRAVVF